jgi:type VI secretion system secreted protein VgrG
MAPPQIRREISVDCALGTDVLQLSQLRASEGLSVLSEYTLDLYSERADIQPDDLLATPATVTLNQLRCGQRHFNGIITRFSLTGRRGHHTSYQATMRPWLWFLMGATNCRIFQEKNVLEIIRTVFAQYAIADLDTSRLRGRYQPYPYCMQYHETDFNFVSRLLEHEGIYYYFKNAAGRHTMVLADSYAAHEAAPGYSSMFYMPISPLVMPGSEVVHEWTVHGEIAAGAPAGYHSYQLVQGKTNARGLFPGCLFKLSDHPRIEQNREVMMIAADYTLSPEVYELTQAATPRSSLVCTFSAIAKHQQYRPARTTPKPVALGPLTAIAAGKAGEKIHTDQFGRIEVLFRWGGTGHETKVCSCWVHMAKAWADELEDSPLAPRGGQEVILSFFEGDPDRPVIIGSVYNNASS